jgi:GTP-binding protein
MEIKKSVYIGSYVREDKCPTDIRPEYAFIGRSNVGKSSLINMLCQTKDLAKVSGTPGKTQTINYFSIDETWYMVDLPGYGYARISKAKRAEWERMIYFFLKNRKTLQFVFVLIDSMIPPQKIDLDFLEWLGQNKIPFALAYTKTDRITGNELKKNLRNIRTAVLEKWETMPLEFITSAEKKVGKKEIIAFVHENNLNFFEDAL